MDGGSTLITRMRPRKRLTRAYTDTQAQTQGHVHGQAGIQIHKQMRTWIRHGAGFVVGGATAELDPPRSASSRADASRDAWRGVFRAICPKSCAVRSVDTGRASLVAASATKEHNKYEK